MLIMSKTFFQPGKVAFVLFLMFCPMAFGQQPGVAEIESCRHQQIPAGYSTAVLPYQNFSANYASLNDLTLQENNSSTATAQDQNAEKKDEASGEKGEKKEEKSSDEKKEGEEKNEEKKPEKFNVFGQATVISQWHNSFPSPYQGRNSLLPINELASTETATLYLGARLWKNAEIYFNPEVAGGSGISGTLGIAGFPNGEATRVGQLEPVPYVARLYASQTLNFGGEEEFVESAPNQLAGNKCSNRLTFSVGKFSAEDWFDANHYSHDPRTGFMNWALMYNGAWDFPANSRGYTYGMVLDYNFAPFDIRYGIFAEPDVANGVNFDMSWNRAHGQAWEISRRYKIAEHSGRVAFMFFLNRAHMGDYQETIDNPAFDMDVTRTREYRYKYGFGLNWEQEFTKNLGGFLRWGWNDGHTETWAFTEIDRTVSFGLTLKGEKWHRPQDELGLGMVINGLSPQHRQYLADGGFGFIIGDGRLNYGPEVILEQYYSFELKKKAIWLTPDLQLVENPAYNRDRGPVFIAAVRFHAEF